MKSIVFLVSGGGANLKFIHYALQTLTLNARIAGVISDREVPIEGFLHRENIDYIRVNYNKKNSDELMLELKKINPDVIVTNIHKIITSDILDEFKDRFINLHYSLLPAFSGMIGMKTVEEARKCNVGFVGGTCHEVNEIVDAGKILYQSCFRVNDWEQTSFDTVVDTVFKSSCLLLLSGVMHKLGMKSGRLSETTMNGFNVQFSPALLIDTDDFAYDIFKRLL